MLRYLLVVLACLGLLFASVQPAVAQCPMCKSNLESARKSETRAVGTGLNAAILMLMITPYVLVAGAGFMWYRARRRKRVAEIYTNTRLN